MNRESLINYLSKHLDVSKCTLEGLLHIGGKSQERIYKRVAASIRLGELLSNGKYPQEAYNIIADEFSYTQRYVKMLKSRFPHHFFKFSCNEG